MRLCIDISQIVFRGTGVGRFTHGLTQAIIDYDSQNKWSFFFSSLRQRLDPVLKESILKKGCVLYEYRLPPSALSFLWNTIHHVKVEKLIGMHDWFITSDWTEPPSCMKKATIIHDLVYLLYPKTVHSQILSNQKQRMRWVKRESDVIFADSMTTKTDIEKLLHIEGKRIHVNYPGVSILKPTEDNIQQTLQKFNLEKPYILTVGKIEPRKNIAGLINAFCKLQNPPFQLIVVGPQGWDKKTTKQYAQTKMVRFLNYISDVELSALYASCLFFIYPSFYEGFGYPIIEAMRLNAPVATSNVSSMKEIAKDSALFFDPNKREDIVSTLKKLASDEILRNKLKKKGIIRSRQFLWKQYFETLVRILKKSY